MFQEGVVLFVAEKDCYREESRLQLQPFNSISREKKLFFWQSSAAVRGVVLNGLLHSINVSPANVDDVMDLHSSWINMQNLTLLIPLLENVYLNKFIFAISMG